MDLFKNQRFDIVLPDVLFITAFSVVPVPAAIIAVLVSGSAGSALAYHGGSASSSRIRSL